MGTFFKVAFLPLVFATFLAGCGGGGSSTPADNAPPSLSNDATLSALTVSTGSLNEAFSSSTYSYTQTTDVQDLTVTATLSDANALMTINGIAVASTSASRQIDLTLGANTITVVVTAENSSTTQTYTIEVTRLSSDDASLSALALSAGDLDQIFQSNVIAYTGTTGFLTSSTTLTATANHPNATLTLNGVEVSSGSPSDYIDLAEGNNILTVVVTAEDGVSNTTYTIELTRQALTAFAQQAYIKASNTEAQDRFGMYSVALSGNTLAVGAYRESSAAAGIDGNQSDNSAPLSGAVYVFTQDPSGTWSQQGYIKASNPEADDQFGWSVALSGDTLAVGARQEDSNATGIDGNQADNSAVDSGAVYVFTRDSSGSWSQQAYVKASNTESSDFFGYSVSLDSDWLAVGAYWEDGNSTGVNGSQGNGGTFITGESGAVYVFNRDSAGAWTQHAYVKASNTGFKDRFGVSVALSGDTLAVGAYNESSAATGVNGNQSDDSAPGAGAVYVFTRNSSDMWSQQAYIKASDTQTVYSFGQLVALSGDTLAVASPSGNRIDPNGEPYGAAYVFSRNEAGTWSQEAYITASNESNVGWFGTWIGLSGNTLAVGAEMEDSASIGINGDESNVGAMNSGAVYVYTKDEAGTWMQRAYVKASNTRSSYRFGNSVALSGGTLAIASPFEGSAAVGVDGDQSDMSAAGSGAVYVFQ